MEKKNGKIKKISGRCCVQVPNYAKTLGEGLGRIWGHRQNQSQEDTQLNPRNTVHNIGVENEKLHYKGNIIK